MVEILLANLKKGDSNNKNKIEKREKQKEEGNHRSEQDFFATQGFYDYHIPLTSSMMLTLVISATKTGHIEKFTNISVESRLIRLIT